MKVTIIGKVDLNDIKATTDKFIQVQIQLIQNGYDVTSIVKSNVQWIWDRSIEAKERVRLVTEAQAVYVLPDWGDDPIAMIQVALAHTLCKKVVCSSNTILPNRITFYTDVPQYSF